MSRRTLAFAGLLAGCVLVGGVYVALAALGDNSVTSAAAVQADGVDALPPSTRILVRAVDPSSPRLNGVVEQLSARSSPQASAATPQTVRHEGLTCERLDFAAGHGVCLAVAPSGVDYVARIFDRNFVPVHTIDLTGLPSRVRVSPDGRYASVTVFATGDSYTAPGQFSTRTNLIDMRTDRIVADLESFRVTRDGTVIHAVDFNFWGVTFAHDSNRFYATLGTGNEHYLVEGDIRERTARVIADDVECPALSPDNRRIGFKQSLGKGRWRFSVLDLASGKRWSLAERRSIDDQLEWLDNKSLLYGDGTTVWIVRADGSGQPTAVASNADSPVVLR